MKNKLIEVKHLDKFFKLKKGILKAIQDVSFDIYEGETLGIVGESGCGKTTCGRTCVGIYEKTAGEILYRGTDIFQMRKCKRKEFTGKVQCIFQDPYASLDPRMRVGEILGEGIEIHKLAKSRSEREELVEEMLRQVGLRGEYKNRFPHEFSGGQRQRIGIARALSVNPEFVFCDEPISALDLSVQAQIMNLLMDLQNRKGLTYLFVSHDIAMVHHISDRIAVFYMGRLVEIGDADEVYFYPQHPYTKMLLSAVPIADPKKKLIFNSTFQNRESNGVVNMEKGCPFYHRCPYAEERCRDYDLKRYETSSDHFVACIHAEK